LLVVHSCGWGGGGKKGRGGDGGSWGKVGNVVVVPREKAILKGKCPIEKKNGGEEKGMSAISWHRTTKLKVKREKAPDEA